MKKNKFYKYRAFNDYTNQIITHKSLYFSPIRLFNDPFDCRLFFQQDYEKAELEKSYYHYINNASPSIIPKNKEHYLEIQKRTIPKLIDQIGVLSLSKNYDNILMWSHYSASHTGLVFEFEPTIDTECFVRPMSVEYHDNYQLLSYTKPFTEESIKLMLTKHLSWKYEEEFRCIDLQYYGAKQFLPTELTGIIFGAKAKKCDIQEMIDLCHANGFGHVKFKQAKILSNGEFGLSFDKINLIK